MVRMSAVRKFNGYKFDYEMSCDLKLVVDPAARGRSDISTGRYIASLFIQIARAASQRLRCSRPSCAMLSEPRIYGAAERADWRC